MSHWFVWIVGFMRPCVDDVCGRVILKAENLNDPFPNCFALENLFHWHALNVDGFCTVKPSNYVFQFLDITHEAASTKSPTVKKSLSIPAAIAGVQRKVL